MRILMAILLALLPATASALSCAPPNPGREFNISMKNGVAKAMILGTLRPAGRIPIRSGYSSVTATYRLTGARLFAGTNEKPFDEPITFSSRCTASWCGRIPREPVTGLFLLRPRGEGFLLLTGPCRSGTYPLPDADQKALLQACLDAGKCSEEDLPDLVIRTR